MSQPKCEMCGTYVNFSTENYEIKGVELKFRACNPCIRIIDNFIVERRVEWANDIRKFVMDMMKHPDKISTE